MLCDKHRMPAHGSLPPVVARKGGGQALFEKLPPMIQNDRQSFFGQIRLFFRPQFETASKLAPSQGGKQIVQIPHCIAISSAGCGQLIFKVESQLVASHVRGEFRAYGSL